MENQTPVNSLHHFKYFSDERFILDVRLIVWEMALNEEKKQPQFVTITPVKSPIGNKRAPKSQGRGYSYQFSYSRGVPSLLQVNKESRRISSPHYKQSFSGVNDMPIYFNPLIDTLFLSHCSNNWVYDCPGVQDDIELVRKLAIYNPPSESPDFRTKAFPFRSLQTLTLPTRSRNQTFSFPPLDENYLTQRYERPILASLTRSWCLAVRHRQTPEQKLIAPRVPRVTFREDYKMHQDANVGWTSYQAPK